MLVYKFVELSVVDDQSIEECVNEWVSQGWNFDGMHFAMAASSRRPSMAFLSFIREDAEPKPESES